MGFRILNIYLDVLQLSQYCFHLNKSLTPIDSSEVRSTLVFPCDYEQATENQLFDWHE